MTEIKNPITLICPVPLPEIETLMAAREQALIFDLRSERDEPLSEMQPAYLWLWSLDKGETPSRAVIDFAVKALELWCQFEQASVIFLADDGRHKYVEKLATVVRATVNCNE